LEDVNKMKGGKVETQKIVLWAIIGLLLLAVIYTVFFQGGSSTSSLSSTAGQAASAYSGMVGGC
jgi:TctA family transporter